MIHRISFDTKNNLFFLNFKAPLVVRGLTITILMFYECIQMAINKQKE